MHGIAKILLLLLVALKLSVRAEAVSQQQSRLAIEHLDKLIARRNTFIVNRQRHIDSLRSLLAERRTAIDSVGIMARIAEEYTSFHTDSAIVYFREAARLSPDPAQRARWRMNMGALLPLAGFNTMAINIFTEEFSPDTLPPDLKTVYYDRGRQMYSYVASAYASHPEYAAALDSCAGDFQAQLLQLLPKASADYRLHLGEYYLRSRQYERARAILDNIVSREPVNSNIRARAANMLAQVAEATNDHVSKIYYLALSSQSDVISATREVKSLQSLGIELNALGDIDRAYTYISVAMENAVNCHASTRMVESSNALPIIEQAYQARIAESRRTTMWVIVALIVVIALLAGAFLRSWKVNKREKALHENLHKANEVKEVYISRFLSLCSIYMDKLSSVCDLVNRKITAGKVDDLQRMVRSGRFIEEQSGEFYETFDDAFLHICPTFVADVNALLQPDKQIVLAPSERLNTDLRILAFLRLGIDEASQIARVLNYSVNTIYAYRNRLKARAIDRDNFEDAVKNIGK